MNMLLKAILSLLFRKRNRITVLLGAGAALELHNTSGKKPTTAEITHRVVDIMPETIDLTINRKREVTLLKDIYERACAHYHPQLNPEDGDSYGKVHFEVLFHLLEELTTYDRSFQKGVVNEYATPFSAFVLPAFIHDRDDLYIAKRHLIDTIFKAVAEYNDCYDNESNDWYRMFWQAFKNKLDVFNLNYDTTIEQSIGKYEDGYEDIIDQEGFQRFNFHKLTENKEKLSTVNHLHGCVVFGRDRYKDINHDAYDYAHQDLYKWPSPEIGYKMWQGVSSSNGTTQDGHEVIHGPIITGLQKTEKVTCLPYDAYRNNLCNCICRNRNMLIAGYSFGDKYINSIFYRMMQIHGDKTRIILIDYWPLKQWFESLEGTVPDNDDIDKYLRPGLMEHYCYEPTANGEMLLFIKRVAHQDYDVWQHFDRISASKPMLSDNGCLMLFLGGFKNSIENYENDIKKFLEG